MKATQMTAVYISILSFAALLAIPCQAGPPYVLWADILGGPNDNCYGLAVGPLGQVYAAGQFGVEDPDPFHNREVLYTLNSAGGVMGVQTYTGERYALGGVAIDPTGNYYLAGSILDPGAFGAGLSNQFYLAKYTPEGTRLWVQTGGCLDGSLDRSTVPRAIATDGNGNLIIAGRSAGPAQIGSVSFPSGGGPFLCKYDPNGNLLWAKRVQGQGSDAYGYGGYGAVAIDPNGNIVAIGGSGSGQVNVGGITLTLDGPYGGDFFIAKYNPSGDVQWALAGYGGSNGGVAADKEGNIYFNGNLAGEETLHCGKFSPDGQLLWERTFAHATGTRVAMDPSGEPIFDGDLLGDVVFDGFLLQNLNTVDQNVMLFKTGFQGTVQWAIAAHDTYLSHTYGPLLCDAAGNIYVSGVLRNGLTFGSVALSVPPSPDGPTAQPDRVFVARLSESPPLSISQVGQQITLSWPAQATGYVLESADSLTNSTWVPVPDAPADSGSQKVLQLPLDGTPKFFRLHETQ